MEEFNLIFRSVIAITVFIISPASLSAQGPTGGGRTGEEWIDPVTETPSGTEYHLFATPSRGEQKQASYLIFLPPSYKTKTTKRYPVLYWLHGGRGSQREGGWMVNQLELQMRKGTIPEIIVVLVQGLPTVRYVNTKDGTKPVESVIIKDLIPHIDSSYRTVNDKSGRALEGMSMGGFGALRLALKFTDQFGAVSALAPSIGDIKKEPQEVQANFGFDEHFYHENSPWGILEKNKDIIIASKIRIRLLVGDEDKLLPDVKKYDSLLNTLNIVHGFKVIAGASHRYDDIFSKSNFNPYLFWKECFGNVE